MKPKKPSSSPKKAAATPRPHRTSAEGQGIAKSQSASASAAPAGKPARKAPAKVPSILLEGDQAPAPKASGPGQRYALGPAAPAGRAEAAGELPEAYGTAQLLLAARDPHWLYAHWDLTAEQQRRYNSLSADRHLILRIYFDTVADRPVDEIHVHPESRHWFVPVERAGAKYVAAIGYYDSRRQWTTISVSAPTLTPPDAVSSDTSAEFTTVPWELPMSKLLALVKEAVKENVPLAEALQQLRAQGHPGLPALLSPEPSQWTPAQERALAKVVSMDQVRRVWMGSLEITELIRRQFVQELASMAAAQFGAPTSPMGISSPAGGMNAAKGFWFNVNAELIVYGATEPTATVTIGGRTIKLRQDGSFSYRFALPDGQYELPIVAVSADQTDGRAAEMKFSRRTDYRGDVGTHPQDSNLRRPAAEHV